MAGETVKAALARLRRYVSVLAPSAGTEEAVF